MAYTHSKYEAAMAPVSVSGAPTTVLGVNFGLTGIQARWAPGVVPHIIRKAAVMLYDSVAAPANAAHLSFRADISAPGTATELFKIVWPTTVGANTVMYVTPTYDVEIKPGQQVNLNVTAIHTAGAFGQAILYVEPRWEDAGNLTGMVKTT